MNENEAKHTPGPWRLLPMSKKTANYAIYAPNGSVIAKVNRGKSVGLLIAAAPDLLELARQIILAHEQEECAVPNDIVAGAYAALAKAKGEA